MWHMMWRLLDVFMCEMILLARSSSLTLFLKYSSFCGSLNPRTSVTWSTHLKGILLAAAGRVVIQRRAEGSRFPLMRFVSRTSTEVDSVTSQHILFFLKSRGSRHSSRPSKMNRTLYFS
ncbi:hypothetical protein J4Q44_G00383310 [Coregonus suidteri]|uniref:Secreted protein n=1 Tax=Coregonus suidteri TaxID=861788 RepID=A0AAN8KSF5_9TELE